MIDLSKIPYKNILIVILIIVCIITITKCNTKSVAVVDRGLEEQFVKNVQSIIKGKNKQGQELVSQKILSVTKDRELEKTLLENSELKILNEHLELTQMK